MVFDYNEQKAFTESIDVVDIGNTALRCISDSQAEYYILIKTFLGKTSILKFGPLFSDLPEDLENGFSCSYSFIDYKENLIRKEINKFINNPYSKIISIEELLPEEAIKFFPDVSTNFFNIGA